MTRVISHIRANAVAYLALFVALGGTSYAATRLPAGSVGNRAIRNHSIDPDKLNPRFIRGNVRVWASVSASGKVMGGGHGVRVIPPEGIADAGVFTVEPLKGSEVATPRRCAPIVSVDDSGPSAGFANAEVNVAVKGESPRWQVVVETYGSAGQPESLPFDLEVIC